MKIIFNGVWMASDIGETVSFIIDLDSGEKILVDCGTNLVHGLIKANVDPMSITHIIVTHSHGDHIAGLPSFLFYRYFYAPGIFEKTNLPIKIISSPQCLTAIKNYVGIPYPMLVEPAGLEYIAKTEKEKIIIGDSEISFFKSNHSPHTLGFTCTSAMGKIFTYTSDTAVDEQIIKDNKDADFLIHDVAATSDFPQLAGGHTLCSQVAPLLEKYHIKNFIPVHRISPYKYDIERYMAELRKDYSGNIVIPNDGTIINI